MWGTPDTWPDEGKRNPDVNDKDEDVSEEGMLKGLRGTLQHRKLRDLEQVVSLHASVSPFIKRGQQQVSTWWMVVRTHVCTCLETSAH